MANSKKPQSVAPQKKIVPPAAPVKPAAPAAPAAVAFPAKELDGWLKGHQDWNHDEWVALLADLKKKGFGELTGSLAGQESIGLYIETHRGKAK